MIATWRSWSFSDEMILEAARRSANAQAPLSYMNKLLSEWKRLGAYSPSEIPEREAPRSAAAATYKSEATIAADERSGGASFLCKIINNVYYTQLNRQPQKQYSAAADFAIVKIMPKGEWWLL